MIRSIIILIVVIAFFLWLISQDDILNDILNDRPKLIILCIIGFIGVLGAISDMIFNSKAFKDYNNRYNNNPDQIHKSSRHSMSLDAHTNIQHEDIYKVVSDDVLLEMYPGILIKEPSMHNQLSDDQFNQKYDNKPKQSIWSNFVCNFLHKMYLIQYLFFPNKNICSHITQKNKIRSSTTSKSKSKSRSKSNQKSKENNNTIPRKSNRNIPPPPPRKTSRNIPAPPPRKIKQNIIPEPSALLPPPPPPDALPPNESLPKSPLKPKKNLPSLSNALLKDIHKGTQLKATENNSPGMAKCGPAIARNPKTSNVRKSLLKQIQQGTLLRKSSVHFSKELGTEELSPWANFSKQMSNRRQFFNEEQDSRSSFSFSDARSSNRWLD